MVYNRAAVQSDQTHKNNLLLSQGNKLFYHERSCCKDEQCVYRQAVVAVYTISPKKQVQEKCLTSTLLLRKRYHLSYKQ